VTVVAHLPSNLVQRLIVQSSLGAIAGGIKGGAITDHGRTTEKIKMEMDDEFDDADLSAAIALSMQADNGDRDAASAGVTAPSYPARAATRSAPRDFDCMAFYKLMFDGIITTQNDKERWIHERITTTFLQTNGDVPKASVPTNPCGEVKTHPNSLEIFTGSGIEETGDEVEMTTPMQLWGLTQSHGGPCGVLAALQAEMIRLLLFGRRENKVDGRSLDFPFTPSSAKPKITPITPDEVNEAMAMAIGIVLARAAITNCVSKDVANMLPDQVRLVLPETRNDGASPGWIDAMLNGTIPKSTDLGLTIQVITPGTPDEHGNGMSPAKRPRKKEDDDGQKLSQTQQKIIDLARLTADYLLGSNTKGSSDSVIPLESFQDQGGILCLVMSLVETRGIGRIRGDMDDPNSTITAQFGHSSQELINLTLTGQAVSNTFDNSMNLSEDLHCHGIQSRPAIGYLSILEALRYCEVGGYYKSPLFPIWVIGSTSHFSVLFGDDRCLKESKSDLLLEQCRRAFMKIEGGGGEAGFIPLEKLGDVLDELDLRTMIGGDAAVQMLQAYLDMSGIILWDKFWKAVSRLMTGSSVQAIVSSDDDEPPPLLLCDGGVDDSTAVAGDKKPASTSMMESDEALARKLAEEMGSIPSQEPNQPKSDEELARELQEEFNRESGVTTLGMRSTGADADTQVAQMDLDEMSSQLPSLSSSRTSTPPPPLESASPKTVRFSDNKVVIYADNALPNCSTQRLDFEKHGASFPLYHYNGLSGGKLTPLRLTRLSATEAVGATVALSSKGSGHGGDLEDVIRTKWPSSAMNWFGKKTS